MVGPSLVEVMQHDGPICARGPLGRRPFSPTRIRLCFYLSCLQRQKGGCAGTCTQRGGHSSTLPRFAHRETEVQAGAEFRGLSILVAESGFEPKSLDSQLNAGCV